MLTRRSVLAAAAGWTLVGASAVSMKSLVVSSTDRSPTGSAPEAYFEKLTFETERWTKVVKENDIKVEG